MIRYLLFIFFIAMIIIGIGYIIVKYNPNIINVILRKELKSIKNNKKNKKLLNTILKENGK